MFVLNTRTTPPQPPTTPENRNSDPETDRNDLTGTDVSHHIPPPPVDQFYDTLEDAWQSIREFTKEHGYALTKLRYKKERIERSKRCICSAIVANFVPLVYRNKTDRDLEEQYSLIVHFQGH
jgi:hypothetical protein